MTTPAVAERPALSLEERFVLAQVDSYTLAFPALWVSEIARFQQSQILELPFYQAPLLGLMHQNGQVMPLVSAAQLLRVQQPMGREISTVVRLGDNAGRLAQVGIVVDKILSSVSQADLPESVCQPMATLPTSFEAGATVLLRQEWFSKDVWQPQQWLA